VSDVHDSDARSRNMRAIRSKNTKPELIIRSLLHAEGFRFRLHRKDLPGNPDLVLPKYKAVILVHGCFWHGHQCHLFKVPRTRQEFWLTKIGANCKRDERDIRTLIGLGWRVMVIWECSLKGKYRLNLATLSSRVTDWLRSDLLYSVVEAEANRETDPNSPTGAIPSAAAAKFFAI
jgi:DNA mismatch endonuclease, patch repair protein